MENAGKNEGPNIETVSISGQDDRIDSLNKSEKMSVAFLALVERLGFQ